MVRAVSALCFLANRGEGESAQAKGEEAKAKAKEEEDDDEKQQLLNKFLLSRGTKKEEKAVISEQIGTVG